MMILSMRLTAQSDYLEIDLVSRSKGIRIEQGPGLHRVSADLHIMKDA